MIDSGASETAAVADINRDGRLDIISGEDWYQAPAGRSIKFPRGRLLRQLHRQLQPDCPIDVDGDGYPDIVDVSWFAKKIAWWKNPGKAGGGAVAGSDRQRVLQRRVRGARPTWTTTARALEDARAGERHGRSRWYEAQERRVGQARRQRPDLRSRHRRRRRQRRRPQRHPDAARLARSAGRSRATGTGRFTPTGRR